MELQVNFSRALERLRQEYLIDALLATVKDLDLTLLNDELARYVPENRLKDLAGRGLRGELLYPVPCLFEANPRLLGYYRMLLGYSMKEVYRSASGMTFFQRMESAGFLGDDQRSRLPELCAALISAGQDLVDGIGIGKFSREFLDDLTLLTLGPFLRGSSNVARGVSVTEAVKALVRRTVHHAIAKEKGNTITLVNASKREVVITFGQDPDITVREEIPGGAYVNLLAIEVKGGGDESNVHNRIGEAEKSHQKAKSQGYRDFWTMVNVDSLELNHAKEESPTTTRFWVLSALMNEGAPERQDFVNRLTLITGIIFAGPIKGK